VSAVGVNVSQFACLGRFRERLAALEAGQVRAVGTNTLRRARRRNG
jgi:exopolyphosphatase/pppGpp-phosphohydrolase